MEDLKKPLGYVGDARLFSLSLFKDDLHRRNVSEGGKYKKALPISLSSFILRPFSSVEEKGVGTWQPLPAIFVLRENFASGMMPYQIESRFLFVFFFPFPARCPVGLNSIMNAINSTEK